MWRLGRGGGCEVERGREGGGWGYKEGGSERRYGRYVYAKHTVYTKVHLLPSPPPSLPSYLLNQIPMLPVCLFTALPWEGLGYSCYSLPAKHRAGTWIGSYHPPTDGLKQATNTITWAMNLIITKATAIKWHVGCVLLHIWCCIVLMFV